MPHVAAQPKRRLRRVWRGQQEPSADRRRSSRVCDIGTVQSQGSLVIQQADTAPTPSGTLFGTMLVKPR